MQDAEGIAYLSSSGAYTSFSYGPHIIRFRTPAALRRYTDVRTWDHGYLVVVAEYDSSPEPIDEYIDLVPILENLYFDPDEFLSPIEEVCIR